MSSARDDVSAGKQSAVIRADLQRADWQPIDPKWRTEEVRKLIAFLKRRVRGQPRAIDAVADAYELLLSGYRDPRRPIASLVFLGPSGVGKTEIVRALCEYLFSRNDAMTRVDCSEYQERHQISRLIGAPPGYVRSDEMPILAQERIDRPSWEALRGPSRDAFEEKKKAIEEEYRQRKEERRAIRAEMDAYEKEQPTKTAAYRELSRRLTEVDRVTAQLADAFERVLVEERDAAFRPGEKPYLSVILFDEIEKAHPDLHNLLLQIMDEGRLTVSRPHKPLAGQKDGAAAEAHRGETTSFSHSFVIMTSNAGREKIEQLFRGQGFGIGFSARRRLPQEDPEAFSQEIYEVAMKEFRSIFKPEFRGRLDRVVVFRPLSDTVLRQILADVIEEEAAALRDRYGVVVIVADAVAASLLAEIQEHPEEGARLLRRKAQHRIVDPIRRAVVSGQVGAHDVVAVTLEETGEQEGAAYRYDARTRKRIERLRRRGIAVVEVRVTTRDGTQRCGNDPGEEA